MKNVLLFFGVCILVGANTPMLYAQDLPALMNEEGVDLSKEARLILHPQVDTIKFAKLSPKQDFDSLEIEVLGYNTMGLMAYTFWNLDTIVMQREDQILDEVVAAYKILQRESHEQEHVVDFYFLGGRLYSLRKNTRSLQVKTMCIDDSCFEVPMKTKLTYTSWKQEPLVQIDNDLKIVRENGFENFGTIWNLDNLKQIIGEDEQYYYLKSSYFYGLVNEYSLKAKGDMEIAPLTLALIYDSSTFNFLSHHAYNTARGVSLYFPRYHPKDGQILRRNDIDFGNIKFADVPVLRSISGNEEFVEMLDILQKASSEGVMFDGGMLIANFTRNYFMIYKNDAWEFVPFATDDLNYLGAFRVDEARNKVYFSLKAKGKYRILEFDLNTHESRILDPNFRVGTLKQWGVKDGRIYYLVLDPLNNWQRVLYSYDISRLAASEN